MNKKEKQIREEFKKLVILGNHPGKSYEEALKLDSFWSVRPKRNSLTEYISYKEQNTITIGRVMKALGRIGIVATAIEFDVWSSTFMELKEDGLRHDYCYWELTKENGQECQDDDQNIETIEKLLTLLKK